MFHLRDKRMTDLNLVFAKKFTWRIKSYWPELLIASPIVEILKAVMAVLLSTKIRQKRSNFYQTTFCCNRSAMPNEQTLRNSVRFHVLFASLARQVNRSCLKSSVLLFFFTKKLVFPFCVCFVSCLEGCYCIVPIVVLVQKQHRVNLRHIT